MLLSAFGIALEFEVNVALNETMDDENDVRTSWVIYKKIRKQYFIYWDASIIYVIQNSIKICENCGIQPHRNQELWNQELRK